MPDGFDVLESTASQALAGLSKVSKSLPPKLFYDEEGCRLFGEITRLPEYYITRAEHQILGQVGRELPVGGPSALVEYGASDESKAVLLMESLDLSAYVPIDVARPALDALVQRMRHSHPGLPVFPLAADFLQPLTLPRTVVARSMLGFFPGSTIGNFEPAAAEGFLLAAASTLGPSAYLLVGLDLRKDPSILIPAYDDAAGVTAAFNLNILARLNREARANFDLAGFRHVAVWNGAKGRIEMHLKSLRAQTATVAGTKIWFDAGETIHTENSYKHTIEGFQALAKSAGWNPVRAWTGKNHLVCLQLLQNTRT